MSGATFLKYEKPLLTCMVQAEDPDRVKELMEGAFPEGAEAFGMQFCKMKPEYRTRETYRELFDAARGLLIYVTNYRGHENSGKSDRELGDELVELARYGATLCDVMGDYFDTTEGELTMNADAIEKQTELIARLHAEGAEVLMSSHVMKFLPAERVLEIAREHKRRGADISKIVTGAESMEQQIENLRAATLLKKELDIPFLFLSGGETRILRHFGGELGCCMYLCVHEHDALATRAQPLLTCVKEIRDRD